MNNQYKWSKSDAGDEVNMIHKISEPVVLSETPTFYCLDD